MRYNETLCAYCKYYNINECSEPCSQCKHYYAISGHHSFFEPIVKDRDKYIERDTQQYIKEKDNVNHPNHYAGKIKCIDAMIETQGIDAVKNFCICNAFKYLWRHDKRNGIEDVKKAVWYLNKFIELEEKEK